MPEASIHAGDSALTELAVRAVGSATTCGITLFRDGRAMTVGSADALAAELDEQQYEQHAGPGLEALAVGESVEAVDLAVETRWGVYPAVAMSHGIRSVLSTPLLVDGRSVGVLNLSTPTRPARSARRTARR